MLHIMKDRKHSMCPWRSFFSTKWLKDDRLWLTTPDGNGRSRVPKLIAINLGVVKISVKNLGIHNGQQLSPRNLSFANFFESLDRESRWKLRRL